MAVNAGTQTRLGWLVVLMFAAGGVMSYVDRAALGVLMPQIRQDLSLTSTQYGLAVNSFLVSYTIFYILGGRFADRWGYRRTFSFLVIIWSLANMLHALARGLGTLSLFRALLGMGEGGFFPNAMRATTGWFSPANRAKPVAVYLCGSSLGVLLTSPVIAWMTLWFGWRSAFVATGALGLLLVPLWFILHRQIYRAYGSWDPAPAYQLGQGSNIFPAGDMPLREALWRRKYWMILASRALADTFWFFYLFWMPGYFQEIRAFDLRMVGQFLWIPYLSADIGALVGAFLSSGLIKRGYGVDRSRKTVLIVSAMLCVIGAAACFVSSPYFALALVSLALFGHMSYGSNIHTAITEISPPQHVAVLYGISGAAGTALAAISQPLIGRLIESSGYKPAFVASGLCYLVALFFLIAAGKIERINHP